MRRFAALYEALDATTSTNRKVRAMADYFRAAPPRDAAWALYFLSGRRLKRLVGAGRLRDALKGAVDLPDWLVDECYAHVGDLAETIALLASADAAQTQAPGRSLADWVEDALLPLADVDRNLRAAEVSAWWPRLGYGECYLVVKLMTGALRVGVSRLLVARALAEVADLPRQVILHRLMGNWQPTPAFYDQLLAADDGSADRSRPYPFCLAHPLEDAPATLGAVSEYQAEWKWDGIRAQLIRRAGETWLWTRGEDLVTERYPEIVAAAAALPDGTVLDGEILAWSEADGVRDFALLQKRIGRKTVTAKLLRDLPVRFLAYDLLEHDGGDVRDRPLSERRELLTGLPGDRDRAIGHSVPVSAADWDELAALRETARSRRVEGFMLKRLAAPYATGRVRGHWWKWKVDPYTVDAVMLYAQPGHGRRSNLYTDYTFAVWNGTALVPFAKAYSGLDDTEIARLDRWIRRNTRERFGPVRSVAPEQVFELAFEGIARSTRHKSGVAVRFPRIVRWREDLKPADADTLEDLNRLLDMRS
ncbi:MAG: ATP-dependent DNA ligase [Pseudomonadota bacterium]